jgi:hypothetical protein
MVRMMMFFWVLTPFRLSGGFRRFGGTYCSHFQGLHMFEDGDRCPVRREKEGTARVLLKLQ